VVRINIFLQEEEEKKYKGKKKRKILFIFQKKNGPSVSRLQFQSCIQEML
jgi:hypothetical protein